MVLDLLMAAPVRTLGLMLEMGLVATSVRVWGKRLTASRMVLAVQL
jgi:hypothetical protein